METVWALLGKLFAGVGGLAVIGLIIRWLADRWADRIQRRWTERLQKEIETLRADLHLQQELVTSAISSGSTGFLAAQERRLIAIEHLWQAVLKIRLVTGSMLFLYDLLLQDEISALKRNASILAEVPKTVDEYMIWARKADDNLEIDRPFLGEKLWFYFWAYRAVALRVCMRISKGIEDGEIPPWDKKKDGTEEALFQVLRTVLSEKEIKFSKEQRIGGPSRALELIEQKILIESETWISGTHARETNLEGALQAVESLRLAQNVIATTKGDTKRKTTNVV